MSDDKNKVTDKAGEIAKNIWLAGVGAYGKAVDEAQDSLKKATPTPPKLFRDLVKAGAELEEEAREARANARSSVEERIARVRDNFAMARPAKAEDIEDLHRKVDQLSRKVDALTKLVKAQAEPAKKTPARKKKAAAKKPAAKKAPAKKTAARKKAPARRSKG
ncbi:poly(hydroxyalcanoate) granule associated protein (phasin) [Halioglobus sp. HI00S01]|uniref:phasin family protein n=1 Tax=Halioglobus sp. HI00S01 TaxID=1822214 RepID=UPI0007C3C473|nr:phasin family protein [Halioglobus sp. HI00S01]KZX56836.1 poly(hydroxyalcanoate) granule associated protein (phasin) [Halioglobus sp. HI00S01]